MASKTIEIEIPISVQDNTEPALGNIQSDIAGLGNAASKASTSASNSMKRGFQNMGQTASKGFDSATKSATGFGKSVDDISKKTKSFGQMKIEKVIEAKDKVTSVLSKITTAGKSLTSKAWNVTVKAADFVTKPLQKVFSAVTSPLAAFGVTVGGTAVLTDTIKTYAGFEEEMSKVKAISGATQEQFEQLTAKAKEMGATTKFTATESAQAFEYMAMAGWKSDDMVAGISGIMNLAAASGEDLASVSDIVTDALTAFGLKASDSTHFADVLAQASANANTNVGLMGQTFQYVAPIAGAMGYSIEDTATAIGLMANSGIKGQKAGTALRAIFTRLADPPKDAATAMDQLGISITNSDGSMKSLSDVMGQLRKGFSGLTQEQKTQMASSIAGQEAMSGLLAIVNSSEDDYKKLQEAIAGADGASQKMSDTMLDNVSGKWTLFKSALDGVKISLGERLKPYLMDAIQWMTDHVPDLNEALQQGMDRIDSFVSDTRRKMKDLMGTDEWQDAGFLGKIKLSFDKLIGDPLSEWWENKGKAKVIGKAQELGTSLGTALSSGVLTLLGIDVGSTINDGASVGSAFAKGFASGFDMSAVKDAIGASFKSLLTDAGSIFTGSNKLSSWLSAGLIAKLAIPMISTLFKGLSLGKSILGGFSIEQAASDAVSAAVTEGAAGAITTSGSGLLGLLGKAGAGFGVTSSAGASVAAGAGGVGGIIMTGVEIGDIIRSGMISSKASKEGNQEKSEVYRTAAVGGGMATATGALIGTAILPGLGTAIGAGVGALGGFIYQRKVTGDYEQKQKEIANYTNKAGYAMQGMKFRTQELEDAFNDVNTSADEFAGMMQNSISDRIAEGFGKIKLSSSDLKSLTKQILFDSNTKSFENFSDASTDAASSLSDLASAQKDLQKVNWKNSQGMLGTEEGQQEYISAIKNLQTASKTYLQDQQYQALQAINLIAPAGTPVDLTSGLNDMYDSFNRQYNLISSEIDGILEDGQIDSNTKVKIRINGAEWTMNEEQAMQELQTQMQDLTSKLSDSQLDANLDMMKIKFSGAALSPDSFSDLVSSLQQSAQEAADQYDEAMQISLQNLHLQLSEGSIDQTQFDAQLQALTQGYQAHIGTISAKIEGFELQSIADVFGSSLDGYMPDIEGTVAEKLGTALNTALQSTPNFTSLDPQAAAQALGLDKLDIDTTTMDAIAQEMQTIAASLPDQMTNALANSGAADSLKEGLSNTLSSSIEGMDVTGLSSALNTALGNAVTQAGAGTESGGDVTGLQSALQNAIDTSVEGLDTSSIGTTLNGKLSEALSTTDASASGDAASGLTAGIQASLESGIQNIDMSGVGAELSTKLGESLTTAQVDSSGLTTALQSSLDAGATGLTFGTLQSSVGSGVSSAITAASGDASSAVSSLYSTIGGQLSSTFSAGYDVSTSVRVHINWSISNPSASINVHTSGQSATASIGSNANGGFMDQPMLSWVGEDGPEYIIPVGSKRRGRGLDLWKQAGEALGVPMFADGGAVGGIPSAVSGLPDISTVYSPEVLGNGQESGSQASTEAGTAQIPVNINSPVFQFDIPSNDSTQVMNVIRRHMKEIADELGGELADRIGEVFSNMPA